MLILISNGVARSQKALKSKLMTNRGVFCYMTCVLLCNLNKIQSEKQFFFYNAGGIRKKNRYIIFSAILSGKILSTC